MFGLTDVGVEEQFLLLESLRRCSSSQLIVSFFLLFALLDSDPSKLSIVVKLEK